jgi:hypothetical protein
MISTVEKVLFLKSIDLFSQISGEDLAQIAQITDEMTAEEGDEIFKEGEPGDTLYFIVNGTVRVHTDGNELARLSERQVFGEMALLDSEPRSAAIEALTDLTLLKIQRDDFNDILAEKSEVAQGIIKVLSRRLRRTSGMHAQAVRDRSGPNLPAPGHEGPGAESAPLDGQSPVSNLENPPETGAEAAGGGTKVEENGANGHNGVKDQKATATEAAPKEQAAS